MTPQSALQYSLPFTQSHTHSYSASMCSTFSITHHSHTAVRDNLGFSIRTLQHAKWGRRGLNHQPSGQRTNSEQIELEGIEKCYPLKLRAEINQILRCVGCTMIRAGQVQSSTCRCVTVFYLLDDSTYYILLHALCLPWSFIRAGVLCSPPYLLWFQL